MLLQGLKQVHSSIIVILADHKASTFGHCGHGGLPLGLCLEGCLSHHVISVLFGDFIAVNCDYGSALINDQHEIPVVVLLHHYSLQLVQDYRAQIRCIPWQ